jgi:hypothetical protein
MSLLIHCRWTLYILSIASISRTIFNLLMETVLRERRALLKLRDYYARRLGSLGAFLVSLIGYFDRKSHGS